MCLRCAGRAWRRRGFEFRVQSLTSSGTCHLWPLNSGLVLFIYFFLPCFILISGSFGANGDHTLPQNWSRHKSLGNQRQEGVCPYVCKRWVGAEQKHTCVRNDGQSKFVVLASF
ncbi:unnamed protein product [Sphacelaria rigidula]